MQVTLSAVPPAPTIAVSGGIGRAPGAAACDQLARPISWGADPDLTPWG
jgi:hypothetical protein